MSSSSFCIEQRKKELQNSRKILTIGLVGSVVVHSILALAVVNLHEKTIAGDPIELIIVQEPSPTTKISKQKVNNFSAPKPNPTQITPKKTQALIKTEVSNLDEKQKQVLTKSSKSPEVSRKIQSSSLTTLNQPTQPKIGTSSPLSSDNLPSGTVLENSPQINNSPLATSVSGSYNQNIDPIALNIPNQPTQPKIETLPRFSSNDSKPRTISGNPQGINQLTTGLSNSSLATSISGSYHQNTPTHPTEPKIETLSPFSSNGSKPETVLENPQGIDQLGKALGNSSLATSTETIPLNAPNQPTEPKIGRSPSLSSNNLPSKTVSENPQGIDQLRKGLSNSSLATSVSNTHNHNTETIALNWANQPIEPKIGTAPSFSSNGSKPGTVSENPQGIEQLRTGLGNSVSSTSIAKNGSDREVNNPGVSSSTTVATGSLTPNPPNPQTNKKEKGLRCLRDCKPSYPSILNGAEGSATLQLLINSNGDIDNVTVVRANNNSQINQQALLAAKKMKFSSLPNGERACVQITVNFTVAGSEFDRRARELRQQQRRERQAREQERKAQLAQERQERQRQLESERAEREGKTGQQLKPEMEPQSSTIKQ